MTHTKRDEFNKQLHAGKGLFKLERFEQTMDQIGKPWTGVRVVEITSGVEVCDNKEYYPVETSPDLSRRIVACLNHCQGISTEELEKQNKLMGVG